MQTSGRKKPGIFLQHSSLPPHWGGKRWATAASEVEVRILNGRPPLCPGTLGHINRSWNTCVVCIDVGPSVVYGSIALPFLRCPARPETFWHLVSFLLFLPNKDIKNPVLPPCWACVQLLGAAFHLAHSCCGTSTPRDTEGDGNSCFSFAITRQSDSNTFPLYSAALLAKKLRVWERLNKGVLLFLLR